MTQGGKKHGDSIKSLLADLPRGPGVYLFRDGKGTVIYVGKAQDLRQRVRSYFQQGAVDSPRLQMLREKIQSFSTIVTDTEEEAFILESNLIKEHTPHFNVQFKDDKHYPYLCLTMGEHFPRLVVARRATTKDCRYFGPYSSAGALRETLHLIKKIFPLRSCKQPLLEGEKRGRPCLNFQIKRCLAPCSGEIMSGDYKDVVQQVCLFLEGRQRTLLRKIETEMKEAAALLQFEKAARLRDQYASVEKVMERQKVVAADGRDRDIVALVQSDHNLVASLCRVRGGKMLSLEHFIPTAPEGACAGEIIKEFLRHYYERAAFIPRELLLSHLPAEQELLEQWLKQHNEQKTVKLHQPRRGAKKALLELVHKNALIYLEQLEKRQEENEDILAALAEALELPTSPLRIEGYDISHFGGRETVGSMVVFHEGKPWKSGYRRFTVSEALPGDDYGALAEVLQRRLKNRELPLPDLLLVDGGKGQLAVAVAAVAAAQQGSIPVVALAKEQEKLYLPTRLLPLALPPSHPALKLLQQVRDEAHRFALTLSRSRQAKKSLASTLIAVPGIGPTRSKALLQHFGTLQQLQEASPSELAAVPGMNRKTAATLYDYLRDRKEM